jgi:hypothetical protein
VLPSPWPKGQFTPTVCALLRQVGARWPDGRPTCLVADRALPSRTLFRTLRAPLAQARPSGWTVWPGTYGWGTQGVPATLVVGRGLPVLPLHQRTVGTQRQRV